MDLVTSHTEHIQTPPYREQELRSMSRADARRQEGLTRRRVHVGRVHRRNLCKMSVTQPAIPASDIGLRCLLAIKGLSEDAHVTSEGPVDQPRHLEFDEGVGAVRAPARQPPLRRDVHHLAGHRVGLDPRPPLELGLAPLGGPLDDHAARARLPDARRSRAGGDLGSSGRSNQRSPTPIWGLPEILDPA